MGSDVDIMVTSGDAVTLPVSGTGKSTGVASSMCVGPVTVWDEKVESGSPDVARCARKGTHCVGCFRVAGVHGEERPEHWCVI